MKNPTLSDETAKGGAPGYWAWNLLGEDEGHLDEMLADEPGLEFIGAEDVGDG